jgi:hypothetical protein
MVAKFLGDGGCNFFSWPQSFLVMEDIKFLGNGGCKAFVAMEDVVA